MAEWKDTCNLPRTAFAMKANLQTTEPDTVARWDAMDLYGQIRAARKGATLYLLHDGPPYANGEIHIGTALNKILKDFVVKSHNMLGFDAPYLPGMGLPRPADRAQGRPRAGPEEARDVDRRLPPRLPRLRREVRRDPAPRLQAARASSACGTSRT